jgi:Xaa-Pro aminopeptidase
MAASKNLLIIADSEKNSNMYYATRFLIYDPVVYCRIDGKNYLLLSDLDIDRGGKNAKVDEIVSWTNLKKELKQENINTTDVLNVFFKEMNAKEFIVPFDFPLEHADELRRLGYLINVKKEPFWPERETKSPQEIEHIRDCQKAIEHTLDHVTGIFKKTDIKEKKLFYNGQPLTSEFMRLEITLDLLKQGFLAKFVTVAGGIQAIDPHNLGYGQLPADEFIVFDIFPRSLDTFYWGDMSRTFVVGTPTKEMKRQYDTVLEAQMEALDMIKEGVAGEEVHSRVCKIFEGNNYKTGLIDGRMQGFFHATGHGVGLDLHERPRLAEGEGSLKEGNVVSVEPGLYYVATGGVRIEDLVAVTKEGIDNLNTYRKSWEP